MLNLDEIGKILGVSRYTAKVWADEGKIKYSLIDGEFVFNKEDVDDFVKRTNIKYVKPENPFKDYEEKMNKYYKENDIMNPNDIEKLINEMKK